MIMQNRSVPSTAQKKKLLIAQGARFRVGLTESTRDTLANLQPDVLAKSALNNLVTSASSAFGHKFSLKNLSDANFQTILPIAISAISLIAKRRSLIKPLLIGAITLGAASAIARFVFKRKAERKTRVISRGNADSQHR